MLDICIWARNYCLFERRNIFSLAREKKKKPRIRAHTHTRKPKSKWRKYEEKEQSNAIIRNKLVAMIMASFEQERYTSSATWMNALQFHKCLAII